MIKPKVLTYSVTWRCPAWCLMCGVKNISQNDKDLSINEIDIIFKDKLLYNLDLIRFTGGEPFIREDFKSIVENIWINAKPKLIYITTNGFYTDRIKDFLEYFKNSNTRINIQVSLDAVGKLHDKIRGLSGLYDKVISTLDILKQYKNINVGINQTITRDNKDQIKKVNNLANSYKFRHRVFLALNTHESIFDNNQFGLVSDFSKMEIIDIFKEIEDIFYKRKKRLFSLDYISYTIEKYLMNLIKNKALNKENQYELPCQALVKSIRLLPNGDVVACSGKPNFLYSLKYSTFTDIWNSDKVNKMREEVKRCPGCFVECDVVTNFIYSKYFIKELIKNIMKKIF